MKSLLSSFLLHVGLASWCLLLAWLAFEWLVPGAVSTHLPLYPALGLVAVYTCTVVPWLSPMARWRRTLAWIATMTAVGVFLVVFAMRQTSIFVWTLVGMVVFALFLLGLAYFTADDQTEDV